MFIPKYRKYRKSFKHKLKVPIRKKGSELNFGSYGLKSVEGGRITQKQLITIRRFIMAKLKRRGKFWIRVFPHIPVSQKPAEVRMGKGKGAIKYWNINLTAGTVLFEFVGINKAIAISILKGIAIYLPFKTSIIEKQHYLKI